MANSADPDLDLHCLQRQGISGFSRTRVNFLEKKYRSACHGDKEKISMYSYAKTGFMMKLSSI